MKKILTVAALAFGLLPLSAQETAYKVTGTVPSDVKMVYMGVMTERAPLDSVAVTGGKFVLDGVSQKDAIMLVGIGDYYFPMFNDGTPVNVNTIAKTFDGSELNKKLYGYDNEITALGDAYMKARTDYMVAAGDTAKAGKAKLKKLQSAYEAAYDNFMNRQLRIVEENKDNLIPAVYLSQIYPAYDYDQLKKLMPETAPYYNHPAMARVKAYLAALEKRRPGMMFTDLTLTLNNSSIARPISIFSASAFTLKVYFCSCMRALHFSVTTGAIMISNALLISVSPYASRRMNASRASFVKRSFLKRRSS